MGEYEGKINVPKDTMLFVVNCVFEKTIKESTTKENILKMMPKIYEEADVEDVIKMLPYKAYLVLEDLIEYLKESSDIKKFFYNSEYQAVRYLEEAMIIVMKTKYDKRTYFLNPGVIEKLDKIFSKENREIAKRYGRIEELTYGLLYLYGAVEFNFLKEQISKYMHEEILDEELYDIYFKRLNLNVDVNYYKVKWMLANQIQLFVTYLDEEDEHLRCLISEQKARGLKYKNFTEQEILNRQEYLWDEATQELYEYISSKNEDIGEFEFKEIIKRSELGENIIMELLGNFQFENEKEICECMDRLINWYNNSPQYELGGYSPNELMEKYSR